VEAHAQTIKEVSRKELPNHFRVGVESFLEEGIFI
jgi:hypothetical protein